ncbi:MAG: thiamine pyrophosphate-dependent enzyme [Candidatus Magasanikbacteria bacterium]
MSKYSHFCPGCGQPIILQTMYRLLQKRGEIAQAVLGLDIGCSLLAWDLLPLNTFQTHHGRVIPTMMGFKRAKKDSISIAYAGDGGAYAIGLQSLLWSAKRNEPITVIVANNAVYAMTGGQTAPTTMTGQKTDTSPSGNTENPLLGPELVRSMNKKAYIARVSGADISALTDALEKAFDSQKNGNFSLVEVLSFCPTNWRVQGKEMLAYVENMKTIFPVGEIQ